jgi:hypothetical protein
MKTASKTLTVSKQLQNMGKTVETTCCIYCYEIGKNTPTELGILRT